MFPALELGEQPLPMLEFLLYLTIYYLGFLLLSAVEITASSS